MQLRHVSVLAALAIALSGTAAYAVPQNRSQETIAQRQGRPDRNSENVSQRGQGRGGQRGGGQRWLQELNLTEEQQQQIQEIRDRYDTQMEAKKEQMGQSMQEMGQMMAGNASDRDLRNKHNEVVRLRQEMSQIHFDQMLAIRNVLTPEQRQQFAQQMQQPQENVQNSRGNGRGNRGAQNRGAQNRGGGNRPFLEDDDDFSINLGGTPSALNVN